VNIIRTVLSISTALVVIVVWSLLTVQLVKLLGVDIRDTSQRTNPPFLIIATVANGLLIGVIGLIFRVVNHGALSELGFGLPSRGLALAAGILLVTFAVAVGFVYVLQSRNVIAIRWSPDAKQLTDPAFLLMLLALFVAALQEEVVFRGFLNANLAPYGFVWALLGSSVIFTGFHFLTSKVNAFQVVDWFLGGLILFVIYVATGSIWASAIVHFGRNLANALVFDIADTHTMFRLDPKVQPRYKTVYTVILTLIWLSATALMYASAIS
jgi:membrane protease YdiL (CAAX protease family)